MARDFMTEIFGDYARGMAALSGSRYVGKPVRSQQEAALDLAITALSTIARGENVERVELLNEAEECLRKLRILVPERLS